MMTVAAGGFSTVQMLGMATTGMERAGLPAMGAALFGCRALWGWPPCSRVWLPTRGVVLQVQRDLARHLYPVLDSGDAGR